MSSSGQIRWKSLRRHLDVLLPGWTLRVSDHRRYVSFAGQVAQLPKGGHGKSNPEIEIGHVKRLFRAFDRLDEARERIPQLR